jgi:hypothetical protein
MIKDIVLNLTGGHPQDFASDYAVSLAAGLGAHIAGVAFIYEPVVPGSVLGGIPTDLIEAQRSRNTVAAKEAIARFESTTKAADVSAEARTVDASLAGAPDLFGRIARRFDIAVVGQARHEQGASEELMIRRRPVRIGPPADRRMPHAQAGLKLDRIISSA